MTYELHADDLGRLAYDAYNAGGDPATAGLNYRGEPCPAWNQLPENIREKWRCAAVSSVNTIAGLLGPQEQRRQFDWRAAQRHAAS